jgi:hypothetical protein
MKRNVQNKTVSDEIKTLMRSIPLFKTQAEVNDAMSKIENSGYKEAKGKTIFKYSFFFI